MLLECWRSISHSLLTMQQHLSRIEKSMLACCILQTWICIKTPRITLALVDKEVPKTQQLTTGERRNDKYSREYQVTHT